MRLTKAFLFLLARLIVLLVSPLVFSAASPYAGNQGNSNTTPPSNYKMTSGIQGKNTTDKPVPLENNYKPKEGAKR